GRGRRGGGGPGGGGSPRGASRHGCGASSEGCRRAAPCGWSCTSGRSQRAWSFEPPVAENGRDDQGCGPHGAAVSSLTSWEATSGRNFTAKPSTKSLLANTEAQCARRSASSSNFQRCTSWLIIPVSAWK